MEVGDLPPARTLDGAWSVTFQEERGAPEGRIPFADLKSWTKRPEKGIQCFSGTGTYLKSVSLGADRFKEGRRLWLDLGDVRHLAEVSVNGRPLGVVWKSPFRVDITDAARHGDNELVVKVTNTWKNRLLGDLKLPEQERLTWTLYPFYHDQPDAPLMESGLLGPVRVMSSDTVFVDN